MLDNMFPFWAAIISWAMAQALKPVIYYAFHKEWLPGLILASGGLPSSHTATVASLTLAVGLREGFSSTLFAVSLAFSLIVAYDAANVRYYAGQNVQITQQLIQDLREMGNSPGRSDLFHQNQKRSGT